MKDKAPILFTRLEPTDPETLDWTPDFNLWAARLINDNVSLFTDISDAGEILGRECFFLEELVELIRPPQNTLLHEAVSFLYRCVGQSRPPQITRDYQYYLTVEGDLTRSYEHEESRLTYAYYATVRDGTKKGTLKNAKRAARTLDYEYQILRCQQTRVRVTMSLLLKWLEGGFPATQQEKENPPARIDWANNPELV